MNIIEATRALKQGQCKAITRNNDTVNIITVILEEGMFGKFLKFDYPRVCAEVTFTPDEILAEDWELIN